MKNKLELLKEDFEYDINANYNRLINIVESGVLSETNMINKVVNYLRDALLRMERSKAIKSKEVDDLDDKHDGDWESWIIDAVKLVPEKTINKILEYLDEYIN
jgi:hypothetical protein